MLLHNDDKNFKREIRYLGAFYTTLFSTKSTQQCFGGLKMQICENGDIMYLRIWSIGMCTEV